MRKREIDVGDEDDGGDTALGDDIPMPLPRRSQSLSTDGPSLEEWRVHCALYGAETPRFGSCESRRI